MAKHAVKVWAGLSLLVAASITAGILGAFEPPPPLKLDIKTRVQVSRAPQAPDVVQDPKPARPAPAPSAPPPPTPAPQKMKVRSESAAPAQPEKLVPPSLSLEQPPIAQLPPTVAAPMALPQISTEASAPSGDSAPPLPDDVPPIPNNLAALESPGGHVMVLAVLVNDTGTPTDIRITVGSGSPLKDMTIALAQYELQWTALQPPLLPGELRWLELRIDHRQLSESLLP